MASKKFFEIWNENNLLSSGETEQLDKLQREFYLAFQPQEKSLKINAKSDGFWSYRTIYRKREGTQKLLDKIGENSILPVYKYVVKYLLIENRLAIGEKNLAGLWVYLEKDEWDLNHEESDKEIRRFRDKLVREAGEEVEKFTDEDYRILLSILSINLKKSYVKNGYNKRKGWEEKFKKTITDLSLSELNELAMGMNMPYDLYRVFRKKALRINEMNFYDHDQVLVYLVLNYAEECGEYRLFDAYAKLKKLYPKNTELLKAKREAEKAQKEAEKAQKKADKAAGIKTKKVVPEKVGTRDINQELSKVLLERRGTFKEKFKAMLFKEKDDEIKAVFDMIDSLDKKEKQRTAEKNFKKQWEKFEKKLQRSSELDDILEKYKLIEERQEEDFEVIIGKQMIYRWLYGENIIERANNRNIEMPDDRMRKWGKEGMNHFLDSRIFLETRIRDNTFSSFPTDEERQRNLLLTVIFLNFVLEVDFLAGDYIDRVLDFEIAAGELLSESGFLLVYSGNPYDAFLMNLLSCDQPLDIFRYVWRSKTRSKE